MKVQSLTTDICYNNAAYRMYQSILKKRDQKRLLYEMSKDFLCLPSLPPPLFFLFYHNKAELHKKAFQVLYGLSTYTKNTLDIRDPIAFYFL